MARFRLGVADSGPVEVDLDELIETRLLVTATSGGGKSGVIYKLCEALVGQVQIILIDPEGVVMARCTWTKKRKGVVVEGCGLEAQTDSAFCPRHTFLWNIEQKKEWEDDQAKRARAEHAAHGRTPRTRLQHCAAGYVFHGSSVCSCGKPIEWWLTPNLKNAPYDPMPEETSIAVSHFVTCSRRSMFRRVS